MTSTLRPYQQAALDAIRARTEPRGCVQMATGTGKGHIAGHLPEALGAERVLFLAHRKELIDQLHRHVSRVVGQQHVSVEMADERAFPGTRHVIASIPTLAACGGRRLRGLPLDRVDALVVDEAHHSTAASYRRVFEHFGLLHGKEKTPTPPIPLLGLTATPGRGDGIGLHLIFDALWFEFPLEKAIREGWLVPVRAFTVQTACSLDHVAIRGGEYVEKQLARAVATHERNAAVYDAWSREARGRKTLVFCVNVEHSEQMAVNFTTHGVPARAVHGGLSDQERAEAFTWFRRADGAVLTNCQLVTEGVDLPDIACVVNAAPTKSATAFAQRLGRGTRLAPGAYDYDESVRLGKEDCLLLDVTDTTRDLGHRAVSVMDLFGAPWPTARLAGQDVMAAVAEQHRAVERQQRDRIATELREIPLFAPRETPRGARLAWEDTGAELLLALPNRWTVRVQTDTLDRWRADAYNPDARRWEPVGQPHDDRRELLAWLESRIARRFPEAKTLLVKNAPWRKREPSDGQRELCGRLGIPIPEGATRGDVSDALNRRLRKVG